MLRDGLVAHVGIITVDGSPVVIPMAFAVDGASLLLHGSVASRLMRTGSEVCVTVTIVDGWVFARSLFNSSMNYRSVAVLGVPTVLSAEEKLDALLRLSASLLPGRIDHARGPTDIELRQTTVWRLPLDEASAKIRTGPPVDDEEDLDLPYWVASCRCALWPETRSATAPASRSTCRITSPRSSPPASSKTRPGRSAG